MGNKSIIGQLVSLGVLAFLVWVLLAGSPRDRLDRACRPVDWAGNVATSLAALFAEKSIPSVKQFVANTDYSCQYTIWRLFYEEDFKKALNKKPVNSADGEADAQTGLDASQEAE